MLLGNISSSFVIFSSVMTVALVMVSMMVALDIFLVLEFVRQEISYRLVSLATASSVEGNAGFFQAFLGASSDSPANHSFCAQLLEHPHQSSVALSLGAADFRLLHFPVRQVVNFKIFGPAKMLEDFSVFRIIGYGKFHFFFLPLGDAADPVQGPQSKRTAAQLCVVGNFHLAPVDFDVTSMDQRSGYLFPCPVEDILECAASHMHPQGTASLIQPHFIHQPQGFQFIQSQLHSLFLRAFSRKKSAVWFLVDGPFPYRSWHLIPPL